MNHNIYASILVMFLTIYAVRALPLTLIRKESKIRLSSLFCIMCHMSVCPS